MALFTDDKNLMSSWKYDSSCYRSKYNTVTKNTINIVLIVLNSASRCTFRFYELNAMETVIE